MRLTIVTNHSALKYILQLKNTHERLSNWLARWALELQEYNFSIEVIPGSKIKNADGLLRPPFIKLDDQGDVVPDDSVMHAFYDKG